MKKIYNSVVIDDEKLAREDLKALLTEFPEINIIGEADNVTDAKKQIEEKKPDLIFLDIQLTDSSGFDLVNQLETKAKIIFVTAYDEYAIRAFEVNAKDYLLKPVFKERLILAIEHLNQDNPEQEEEFKKYNIDDNIFLMVNNTYQFIRISTIVKVISAGNYTEIYTTNNQKGLVVKTMNEWERRLPDKNFARIHRNAIINFDYIEKVEEWFNNSYQVYMKMVEKPLIISRRYAVKLKEKLC